MKLPVITTSISGLPEIVDHGINGIVVAPNDEKVLSEAIIKLINDTELKRKLDENARKKVIKRFDINKNITKYHQLFTS